MHERFEQIAETLSAKAPAEWHFVKSREFDRDGPDIDITIERSKLITHHARAEIVIERARSVARSRSSGHPLPHKTRTSFWIAINGERASAPGFARELFARLQRILADAQTEDSLR